MGSRQTEREDEIKEEYLKTLQDLTFNSKPLIDVLTEVADENREYASTIVQCIEEQLERVEGPLKLPILYLIDSIIKHENIRLYYMHLFCQNIHKIFTKVYELGDENVRNKLSKLRFTWNGVLPVETLVALDNMVRTITPNWQAAPPPVHVNPKFVPRVGNVTNPAYVVTSPVINAIVQNNIPSMPVSKPATKEELLQKQRELEELKQRKQELEQELKMLRPNPNMIKTTKPVPDEAKSIERLAAIAKQIFSQVDDLKNGSYAPSEVQQVRKSAVTLKNTISNLIERNVVPNNPKLAVFAKDSPVLKDLLRKLTETEKVLAETEKANQVTTTIPAEAENSNQVTKRKVIMNKNQAPLKTTVNTVSVPSSQTTIAATTTNTATACTAATVIRPLALSRRNPSNNPFVYTKPVSNGNVGVAQSSPQTPHPFRIAPVSTGLINAARRVRDPRLRRNEQQHQVSPASSNSAGTAVNREAKSPALCQVESKNDKRNESPEEPVIIEEMTPKPEENIKSKILEMSKPKKLEPPKSKIFKEETKEPSLPKENDNLEKRKLKINTPDKRKTGDAGKRKSEATWSGKRKSLVSSLEKRKLDADNSGKCKSDIKIRMNNNVKTKMSELFEDTQNTKVENIEVNTVKTLSKEERSKKLSSLAEALLGADEVKQLEFIDNVSKGSPKMAQRLKRLLKEKDASKKPPVVVGGLMDITDDNNDCFIVSSPKEVQPSGEVVSSPVPLTEPSVSAEDVIMEESTDARDQPLTENINVPPGRSQSPHPQDIDIRSLIPSTLPASGAYPLPVVSESIVSPVTTGADTTTFSNPFGLSETKDIDYRQLFGFSLPPIVSNIESGDAGALSNFTLPKAESNDFEKNIAEEKQIVKRKHGDLVCDARNKRKRTTSHSSDSSNSGSDFYEFSSDRQTRHRYSSRKGDSDSDDIERSEVKTTLDVSDKVIEDGIELQPPPAPSLSEDHKPSDLVIMPTSQIRASSKSPPPMFPFFGPSFAAGFSNMNFGMFPSTTPEVPPANPDVLKMIDRDPMKTINIDGIPREIRHYGSAAVVFLNWDDPRQISFSSYDGSRRIIIDNKYCVPCSLNTPDVETLVYGKTHRFRLGVPTRELYVDGIGYECYFGGPPIKVRFDGQSHFIRLDGKPPKVDIGVKRLDLVAGKINIVINDEHTFPVFLDAKPQRFDINGVSFVLMFIDALKRVLINEIPFKTEFGGLPQSFKFNNQMYYFRFTMLPVGIIPGTINIFQMVMTKIPSPPPLPPSLQFPSLTSANDDFSILSVPPVLPNIPNIPVSTVPVHENEPDPAENSSDIDLNPPAVSNLLGTLNLDELLQSLVASGIVSSSTSQNSTVSAPVSTVSSNTITINSSSETLASSVSTNNTVKPVDFKKPETLKQKQPALISMLYSGTQCGSCGMRFPEEQTLKYSEHLDWHFRLNRKGKNGARTIHSRKWYYSNNDWMKFQEMEDNSDRGQSWFDSHPATEYTEEIIEEVPCVSAGQDSEASVCELCRDKFEQFYNEDIDEWQLRNAIRLDEKIYHPICYQDYKVGSREEIEAEGEPVTENPEEIDDSESLPESETILKVEPDEKLKDTNEVDTTEITKLVEDDSDDSDIEEVQLIEEPIEEIIIPDDANDLDEPNLETLNAEEILAVKQEIERSPSPDIPAVEEVDDNEDNADDVVHITHSTNTVSIDGNVELGDSYQALSGPTKIKINIAKNHLEDKGVSPKTEEPKKPEEEVPEEMIDVNEQPPPPGEEILSSLEAADIKPRLKGVTLTVYPPVVKGTETSGLCTIM